MDLSGSTVVLKTRYSYDSADRLTSLSHQTSGGTVRVEYGYTLDDANRPTGESRTWASGASSDSLTYGYTNNDQLTSVSHSNTPFANESFGYDANGNRNTSGYSTGTGNRISTDGVYNYAYDDEGNTTSKTEIATGDQTLYSWDHRNRVTEVDHKVGATTTVLATFTYDALDRRIGEKAGSVTRWTLYDGYSPVLDFNGSGTQVARYLQSVDGVLARETSGGVAWYMPDRLGTVRDLADNSGAIIDHVDYTAFGGVISESSPSAGDRLVGFAQLERDTATGLNLAIHRVQDLAYGRWLSEDPIGFGGGDGNVYRYVKSHPTEGSDSMGLSDKRFGMLLPTDLNRPGRILIKWSSDRPGPGDLFVIGHSPFNETPNGISIEIFYEQVSGKGAEVCSRSTSQYPRTVDQLIIQIKSATKKGSYKRIFLMFHAGGDGYSQGLPGPSIWLSNDPSDRIPAFNFPPELAEAISDALTEDGVLIFGSCGYYFYDSTKNPKQTTKDQQYAVRVGLQKIADMIRRPVYTATVKTQVDSVMCVVPHDPINKRPMPFYGVEPGIIPF